MPDAAIAREENAVSYLLRRLASSTVVLFGVTVLTYGLIHLTPGDPARTVLAEQQGRQPDDDAVNEFRAEEGLDEPIPVQYGNWLGDALGGDLGRSYYGDGDVLELLLSHLPNTIELAGASVLIAVAIALPVGVISAVYRGTWVDYISQVISLLGLSMPNFWLGYLLIIGGALRLGVFPVYGAGTPAHLVLPAITLGTGMAAVLTRLVRSSLLETLEEPYVDAARSRGLAERGVVVAHALRTALLPVVTIVGLQLGAVLGGAVVVEVVFQRPGVGTLLVDAVFARDFPVIQGVTLLVGVTFVVVNLLTDLAYRRLDPRVSLGGGRA
ncbi:peptide/nickel transport system permease protein [Natronorubrum sediminis]|uniref:Peptide/nickel transport system permease protein n=1 Tax=Natronorubrum sediminis TaxID=640943 RepID=A0A1H6FSQ6_9EURY|nr:nickel ABC transporter permease [Natronorubrum sediminis]SEH13280.1 peptide/nickel transport system permease protein [Natronorubrum sediminis]